MVASPELCFAQCAQLLPFDELVAIGYELTGTYRLHMDERPVDMTCKPLASIDSLTRFVQGLRGFRGASKALRALRYVRDGSRSPMETALAMMIVLPRSMGGLGIRDVEMNRRVEVSGRACRYTRRHWFELDIFIARCRLDVEYDGEEHEVRARALDDKERSNALGAMGYQVIRVTRSQFANQLALVRVLMSIAAIAGVRGDITSPEFQARQNELRLHLIASWAR